MSGARDRLARLSARLTSRVIRAARLGAGSTLPGRIAARISPGVLERAARACDLVVLVSGTNGKTTTTALLSAALAGGGRRVITNTTGANLRSGLTTALLHATRAADCAVLEVDEAVLPGVIDELHPDLLVLLNLSRDQLDRYHEVRALGALWRAAVMRLQPQAKVVAVDHDPLVCYVAQAAPCAVMVGVAEARLNRDGVCCPACGQLLTTGQATQLVCSSCQWQPLLRQVEAVRDGSSVVLRRPHSPDGLDGHVRTLLPISSFGYAANTAAAWAAATTLGIDGSTAARAIAAVKVVQDRYAEVHWRGALVRLLLAKNPASWDEILSVVGQDRDRAAVVSINAGIPDGRDTSWLWDVNMGVLRDRPVVVATGKRAADIAVRLQVTGINCVMEPRLEQALRRASAQGTTVDLLADYTSFQHARGLLYHG
jgi:lipid II isoglutaminyl synthase (glutamine-hydrolysing)